MIKFPQDEVGTLLIELAKVRNYVREAFPDLAHTQYGLSQQSPMEVGTYVKKVLIEATKKGRITPAPSPEESS